MNAQLTHAAYASPCSTLNRPSFALHQESGPPTKLLKPNGVIDPRRTFMKPQTQPSCPPAAAGFKIPAAARPLTAPTITTQGAAATAARGPLPLLATTTSLVKSQDGRRSGKKPNTKFEELLTQVCI